MLSMNHTVHGDWIFRRNTFLLLFFIINTEAISNTFDFRSYKSYTCETKYSFSAAHRLKSCSFVKDFKHGLAKLHFMQLLLTGIEKQISCNKSEESLLFSVCRRYCRASTRSLNAVKKHPLPANSAVRHCPLSSRGWTETSSFRTHTSLHWCCRCSADCWPVGACARKERFRSGTSDPCHSRSPMSSLWPSS